MKCRPGPVIFLGEGSDNSDGQKIHWGLHWGLRVTGVLDGREGTGMGIWGIYHCGSGALTPADRLHEPARVPPTEVGFLKHAT